MISRRCFLTGFVIALAPAATVQGAQEYKAGKVPRIGFLSGFSAPATAPWYQALDQGLRDLGWIEGQTIRIEPRYADGRTERLPELAAELVRLRVDLIVTTETVTSVAARQASDTIPIVMASGDPVLAGLAKSLARPGGNVTGVSQLNLTELAGKRLELLKEFVPGLARLAVLSDADIRLVTWNAIEGPAHKLGLQIQRIEARTAGDLDTAFAAATRARAGALFVMPAPLFVTHLKRIAELATTHRLPAMFHLREFAEAGGLVTYGPDRTDLFRRAAVYVDKILKGAKPADLPIEQATKLVLVINLKTAKALGLTIPPSLLLRADQVVE